MQHLSDAILDAFNLIFVLWYYVFNIYTYVSFILYKFKIEYK